MNFTISHETPAGKLGYGTIHIDRRGTIKGNAYKAPERKGGEMTNAKYAEENGITKRQASKQRRGY